MIVRATAPVELAASLEHHVGRPGSSVRCRIAKHSCLTSGRGFAFLLAFDSGILWFASPRTVNYFHVQVIAGSTFPLFVRPSVILATSFEFDLPFARFFVQEFDLFLAGTDDMLHILREFVEVEG
jgi:hypothetical protein